MKILTKIKSLLTASTKQDDTVVLYSQNLKVVYKHNDIGVSTDYYHRGTSEPFRMDQVWFSDVPVQSTPNHA
ncbi:hypothetical protein [Mucilaginibacter polytrichastri]|uniref:Uncharacterized protein n=1 Tax=Mucilaginibacter polytrichastri TaxID=1302689 RepID=A0A1Q6A3Y5_9SPHI|nr:hypothetical protein [Mucilaginibacter polytrichastri]OKS88721.1 hypothetical protein RG47T_4199 [Mucilaginibacter polytrichastri]SFT04849.1 hypothetical protein SAMN04487890_10953 [Mucilaginibacter polytrichastri]